MKKMQEGVLISRSDKMIEINHDKELIALQIDTSKFHMFNPVANRIWEIVKTPISLTDLCTILCDEFDIDIATCQIDVEELVQYLVNEKVIILIDG